MTEYLHPSVNTRITDKSYVAQVAQGNSTLFAAFRSEIGPDNTIRELNSVSQALFEYGSPNLAKYGQGFYNVLNWLQNGGKVYAVRILPTTDTNGTYLYKDVNGNVVDPDNSNARYQHSVLTLETKEDTTDPANPVYHVRSRLVQKDSNGSLQGLSDMVNRDEYTNLDDYTEYPLAVFYPYGRGANYKLGVRFSLMDTLDSTFEFRTYSAYIVSKDSTGADVTLEGPFIVALDPMAKNKNRESIYFANVINKYSQYVKVMTDTGRNYVEKVGNFVVDKILDADLRATTSPFAIDLLFGNEKAGAVNKTHDKVKFNEFNKNDTLQEPHFMAGGSDGYWGPNGELEDVLLTAAYGAILTPSITDKKQYEIDVVMDANYATPVKNKISEFCSSMREDCLAILDCSLQANASKTLDFRANDISMSDFKTSIFAQDLIVFDEYNGSSIKVTSTYFLSSKIPQIDNQFGLHWPFVGPRRGVISGFDAINFLPNEMEKENLYKQQINYIEKDPKRYNFGSQLTSQKQNSALSDINNVRTILRIRRDVEKMMDEYRFEFNDSTTHESMNYSLNAYLQRWVANRACKTISGLVYASDYDRQQKTARVQVSLTFTGIIERVFIDIVVNR